MSNSDSWWKKQTDKNKKDYASIYFPSLNYRTLSKDNIQFIFDIESQIEQKPTHINPLIKNFLFKLK